MHAAVARQGGGSQLCGYASSCTQGSQKARHSIRAVECLWWMPQRCHDDRALIHGTAGSAIFSQKNLQSRAEGIVKDSGNESSCAFVKVHTVAMLDPALSSPMRLYMWMFRILELQSLCKLRIQYDDSECAELAAL